MKKKIWIPSLTLAIASIAWGLCILFAGPKRSSGTAVVRYSSQNGLCRIEAAYRDPFILTVIGPKGEQHFPSSFDIILFRHSVKVVTDATFRTAGSSDWQAKMSGIEYSVTPTEDEVRIRVDSEGEG